MATDSQRTDEVNMEEEQVLVDEDEFVVADMSSLEPQPLLFPRLDTLYKRKRGEDSGSWDRQKNLPPLHLDAGERWALIRGALSAVFLLVAVLGAAFAGLILLISFLWG